MLFGKAEELAWRQGGEWESEEISQLEEMLSFKRTVEAFDRHYVNKN